MNAIRAIPADFDEKRQVIITGEAAELARRAADVRDLLAWRDDGKDNDGDGDIDEADEDRSEFDFGASGAERPIGLTFEITEGTGAGQSRIIESAVVLPNDGGSEFLVLNRFFFSFNSIDLRLICVRCKKHGYNRSNDQDNCN